MHGRPGTLPWGRSSSLGKSLSWVLNIGRVSSEWEQLVTLQDAAQYRTDLQVTSECLL